MCIIGCYTMPENPINAIANKPAVINAIGVPFIPSGTLVIANCSLTPAKMIKAKAKPIAVEIAYTTDSIKLYSFWITKMATPKIQQLVVIKGRNTPNAW